MRLEEWYQYIESQEQPDKAAEERRSKALGSTQSVADRPETPVYRGEPVPAAFPSGDGVYRTVPPNATFRRVAAPSAAHAGNGAHQEIPPLERGRSRKPLPAPVEKESREALLARLLDPVLTLEEAAQVLDVCPTTVRRYTNKGLLQHYRTSGNQRRFKLSHVLSFMESLGLSPIEGTVDGAEPVVRRLRSAPAR